jgi:hypothetical protein
MADPLPPFERREPSPDGLVLAVRSHLNALLTGSKPPFTCRYACFIHPRRRRGERGFGVVTVGGESLPLTVTMLESLQKVPTLLEGLHRAMLGPMDREDAVTPADLPARFSEILPVNKLMLWQGVGPDEDHPDFLRHTGVTLTPTAAGPQLTLLCADRPEGWPA